MSRRRQHPWRFGHIGDFESILAATGVEVVVLPVI